MLLMEGELQASEEIALGDVPGFAGAALLVAAGDVDRGDVAVEPDGAKHVDDGRAEAGGIHGQRAIAGEVIMADDFADAFDDARVRCAEGQAFDMKNVETLQQRALVRAQRYEALQHGDGSGIVFLAEIKADKPGAHRSRAFSLGSMAPSMRSRLK